ncbi:hypothetical protein BDB00DRAFT_833830 [Zychaea mexicana]|uniref:uncharacterized protein n=1 Tax=Zychaea mexicana TaxID=64656 RepID=UPI0022FEF3AD|nr:uncharacterized protein BDB00DRAFT_833830 [Zychaea mexicana]KAI9491289.1 hypothetical protein BDB00DRAFT_833830 [Zychaea mexicana]
MATKPNPPHPPSSSSSPHPSPSASTTTHTATTPTAATPTATTPSATATTDTTTNTTATTTPPPHLPPVAFDTLSMETLTINDPAPSAIATDPSQQPHPPRSTTPQSQTTTATPASSSCEQQQPPPLSTSNNTGRSTPSSSTTASPRLAPPQLNMPPPSSSPRMMMMHQGPPPEPPQHIQSIPPHGAGGGPNGNNMMSPPRPSPPPPPPQQQQQFHPPYPQQGPPPPPHSMQPQQHPYYQPAPVGLDPVYMYHRPESFYGVQLPPPGPLVPPQQQPPLPPQQQFMRPPPQANPWRHSFHAGMIADSDAYMPDSSLFAASVAGRRPKESQFPPATLDNLNKFRREAKASNNPQQLLDLSKYMLEAVPQICKNEKDPKRTAQIREALTTEAYKTVKKLANPSGIGKAGFPEAQYFLAMKYMQENNNMGVTKDADKAFALFMQGAKQNHPACNYRVAVCYEVGAGTKKDKGHAIQYHRKAANLGDPPAMYKLGMVLLKGLLGQSKNPREGISWLKRATQHADQDLPHAFHELGLAYEKEGIPSVIADADYARELFTQAAQYGYAPSQFKLGLAYENGFLNCPIDPRRSIAWYSKAAEQGHLEAELSLSGWYLTGAEGILKQSDSEAYLWARKAADKAYAKAEYAVGYYTETGIGVRQNLEDAKKWYMRAASQQNKRAIQRLNELKKAGKNKAKQKRKHTRPANGRPDDSKDGDCIVM